MTLGQSAPPHPAISRASAVFVRNFLQDAATASGGDFIDAMIRMAITDANVRHIIADEAESRRFAHFDQVVPDELRRPVSIHGVSTSLGLPFETVRRRVRQLSARDLCRLVPGGLIVSGAQLATDAMWVLCDRTYRGVEELHAIVTRHSAFAEAREVTEGAPMLDLSSPPVRVVVRPALAYVLRYLEAATPMAGGMLDGIILLFVSAANVQHLPASAGEDPASDAVVEDDLRRRAAVFGLARGMGLPAETVRRRVNALIERDLCKRDHMGVYIPADVLRSPALVAHRASNLGNLQRLFAELRRAGVRFG